MRRRLATEEVKSSGMSTVSAWQQATVTAALNGRSYKVETDKGKSLSRNRQRLRLKSAPARVTNDVTSTINL